MTVASSKANQSMAVVHGSPFPDSVNFPASLSAALIRAAKTQTGIRYVEVDGTETMQPYAALLASAEQIAIALRAQGLKRQDFVILQFSKSVDLITALWGCFLSGCVPVPLSIDANQAAHPGLLESAIALLESPTLLTDSPKSVESGSVALSSVPVLVLSELLRTNLSANAASESSLLDPSELDPSELDPSDPSASPSADALINPPPGNIALLLLTSGSTGTPKGVQLSHQNIRVSAYGMATVNQLSNQDITLNWMPLEHVASLVMFHLTEVYLGCEQIHVRRETILSNPLSWLDLLSKYRASATWAPNFAYALVNEALARTNEEHGWDLSSIRWMGNGAEAVVGRTAQQFLQQLMPYGLASTAISPGYGMTETCSGIVHSRQFSCSSVAEDKLEDRPVALGGPIPGVSIRIVDEANRVVAAGDIGRLQVKGLTVTPGYYQSSGAGLSGTGPAGAESGSSKVDHSAAAFTSDGWFDTGDLALIRAGALTITGRQKDVIVLNGLNYYSHEIESVVETLAGVEVSFTAACGVRIAQSPTEQLAIFFHPVEGAVEESIEKIDSESEALGATIALIKQIRTLVIDRIGVSATYVIPVEKADIPKTSIGKIQRSQLSRRFCSGKFDTQVERVASAFQESNRVQHLSLAELEQRISQIWHSVLSVEVVDKNDNFFELGGTSFRLMQVLGHLQNQISSDLDSVVLFQYPTVATLAAYLKQLEQSESAPSPLTLPDSFYKRRQGTVAQRSDIAVIGMAGRFPGAPNVETFWQNLKSGVESITFFTDEEMLQAGVDPALLQHPDYVNASPTLEAIDCFDADFFGYSPKEAKLMDPQQRLLLECAWESLETAGYDPLSYEGAIALFAGATTNTYLLNNVYPNRHTLDPNDSLETFTLSSLGGFQATVANDKDYLTTRVSYKLNLRGPSLNVQTACSTSLVSIHLAAQSLLQGECDMALAGGVSVETPQQTGYLYQPGMILSEDGHCRAFDADSKGTLFGSGVGLVVLKRLDEAIAHRDFIYAVIKGSAVGNDGGQKVGYLAPLSEGQTRVTAEALAIADTPAETIGYVEAHGTGTQLGDPIEIAALTQAFRRCPAPLGTDKKQFCPIGSVKTNVGHLNIASGVAGFIKAALAVHYGQIPASLHFQRPNPQIDFVNSPFYVNTALADWPAADTPRRASVNSLGIGGTNVHMVLEEAIAQPQALNEVKEDKAEEGKSNAEIFVLSAKSETALKALARKYVDFLANRSDIDLSDICFTLGVGRSHFSGSLSGRLSLVVDSVADLRAQLQVWLSRSGAVTSTRQVAFLFTGQGAQYAGMGKTLYETQPVFRRQIDHCAEILHQHRFDLLGVLFSEKSDLIDQTAYTQPVLFAFEYAIAQLWMSWGVRPAVVLGHSLGDYVAACVAGVFSLEDGLRLVVERGRLIQALPAGGSMLSVMADAATCQQVIQKTVIQNTINAEGVAIAAINSPENTVLSGPVAAIDIIAEQLAAQGISSKRLKVSHAFHSSLMAPMLSKFRAVADSISYQTPAVEIVSNISGERLSRFDADYWVRHIQQPVCFAKSITTLESRGITTFLECGPRPVLLTLAQATVASKASKTSKASTSSHSAYSWLASLQPQKAEDWQMLSSLAALYRGGHEIDWKVFYRHQNNHHKSRRIPLPTYAFQRQRYWLERPKAATKQFAIADKDAHPLAGQKISTPLRQVLFQQSISAVEPEFLQHHQVQGDILLSGAAFLEMAISVGVQALQTALVELKQVSLLQPLILSERPVVVQTILTPEAAGYRFEIYRQSSDAAEWTLHCEGMVCSAAATTDFVQVEQIKERLGEVRSPAVHYQRCDRAGLSYSGPFRSVQKIWRAASEVTSEALGQIEIPTEIFSDLTRYQIHPAVLDACFQCVLAALPNSASHSAYVPIGAESVCLHRPFPADSRLVLSYVRLRSLADEAVTVTADVQILDERGQAIASITGLAAKRIAPTDQNLQLPQWQDWLYEVRWQPTAAAVKRGLVAGGSWLIVADEGEKLEAIAALLTAQNQNCTKVLLDSAQQQTEAHSEVDIEVDRFGVDRFEVDKEKSEGFRILLQQSDTWRGVLYFASNSVEQSCKGALYLTQALVDSALSPDLWLITDSVYDITGDELLNIAQSPLWGMGKTIALEHPELNCVCLDLDEANGQQQMLSSLMAELAHEDRGQENQIAYRRGNRYVARLARHRQKSALNPGSLRGNLRLQTVRTGTLEQLDWQEVFRQPPESGEVELRVQASGLNFRDVLNALGLYPGEAGPLGLECVGQVVAVGAGVTRLKVGDVVMAITPASFSQFVTVPVDLAVLKPDNLDAAEAATIPTAFLTAYYALVEVGGLKAGDRVLIHAAAGGVGQAAVQIAQMVGAEVFATASPPKWELLRQQGIQHIFNSRTLEFAWQIEQQGGVDVVLNSLAGEAIEASLSVLSTNGRFLEIGKSGIWSAEKMSQQRPDVSYRVIDLLEITGQQPQLIRSMLGKIADWIQDGTLSPLPHRAYAATQSIDAFRSMQQAKHVGKVVVTPPAMPSAMPPVTPSISSEAPSDNWSRTPIRHNATYLITGGMGALGLQLAEWLTGKGATSLILLGRSSPSVRVQQTISQMRESGVDVQTLQLDLSNQQQLRSDLWPVLGSTDAPLKGVFHLAGEIKDALLQNQSWQTFEPVLSAKVTGTWNLHQMTREMKLDHFVMFSSVASLLGSAGQANYAAANSYLDAIAYYRRQQGLPALSVNWAAWSGVGLANTLEVKQRFQRLAIPLIAPETALEILDCLIGVKETIQVGVLPGAVESWQTDVQRQFWSDIDQNKPLTDPLTKPLEKEQLDSGSQLLPDAVKPAVQSALENGDTTVLPEYLQSQLAVVLGKEAAAIDDDSADFSELGLDSLTAVEFRNRLQTSLSCVLPVALVYEYPTLSKLRDYIAGLLATPQREQLEVDRQTTPDVSENTAENQGGQSAPDAFQNSLETISDDEAQALLLQELNKLDQA